MKGEAVVEAIAGSMDEVDNGLIISVPEALDQAQRDPTASLTGESRSDK